MVALSTKYLSEQALTMRRKRRTAGTAVVALPLPLIPSQ
jgi:hypothetical protein